MNKHKQEEQQDVIEAATIEGSPAIPEPQPIDHPKEGYLFPNPAEGLPFGGEFASLDEALEANKHYLAQHTTKKEKP